MGIFFIIASLIGVLLLVKIITVIWLYYLYKKRYGDKIVIKFYPLFGLFYFVEQSYKQKGDSYRFFLDIMRDYPEAKGILFISGIKNIFLLIDPQWCKDFIQFSSKQKKFRYCFAVDILFKNGLVLADYDLWKKSRKFLNQLFHITSIKDRMDTMKYSAKYFLSNVSGLEQYQKINLLSEIRQITTLSLYKTFCGLNNELDKVNNLPFYEALHKSIEDSYSHSLKNFYLAKALIIGHERASTMFLSNKEKEIVKTQNKLKAIAINFIAERKKEIEKLQDFDLYKPTNIIDTYLKQMILDDKNTPKGKQSFGITFELISMQFFTFLFAGSDTTSLVIQLILYYLSIKPELKQKVIEEIKANTPTNFDDVKFEHLNKLTLIKKCMLEVLRLHPPIQFLFPREIAKKNILGDLILEKDLLVCPMVVNYNKFENFFEFNPDRFDESLNLGTYDFIPFSAGSKNCLGQHFALAEIKVFLTYILLNYEIQPVPEYQLKMRQVILIQPDNPFMIFIKKLNKSQN